MACVYYLCQETEDGSAGEGTITSMKKVKRRAARAAERRGDEKQTRQRPTVAMGQDAFLFRDCVSCCFLSIRNSFQDLLLEPVSRGDDHCQFW